MLIGVVGAGFRFCLERAEATRTEILQWAHQWPQAGWLVPVFGAAACAALARYLVVRFAPIAAGSGVQRVEAVIRGEAEPATWRVVPVKFVGGVLAIGSGGALGREGPTVQMGAALGTSWARSAGATVAVAFNAPIGASVFVFEELTRSVTPRLLVATLVTVSEVRSLLGNAPDVVRTPFKGIMLVAEMTERADLALSLLVGALGAIITSTAGSEPIYDTLRSRMPANDRLELDGILF